MWFLNVGRSCWQQLPSRNPTFHCLSHGGKARLGRVCCGQRTVAWYGIQIKYISLPCCNTMQYHAIPSRKNEWTFICQWFWCSLGGDWPLSSLPGGMTYDTNLSPSWSMVMPPLIWWFPQLGVPPNHPFEGDFPWKTIINLPFLIFPCMENLHMAIVTILVGLDPSSKWDDNGCHAWDSPPSTAIWCQGAAFCDDFRTVPRSSGAQYQHGGLIKNDVDSVKPCGKMLHIGNSHWKQGYTKIANTMRYHWLIEGSLEVKLPTICRDGRAEVGRVRRRSQEVRREETRKSGKQEDAGARKGRKVAIPCVFPMVWAVWGSGVSKSNLAKAAGAEPAGQMRDEQLHAVKAREAHVEVKMYKTHQHRTTFGSWAVEIVHSVVAWSTFGSQQCQKLRGSDHFLAFRCRKSGHWLIHSISLQYIQLHYTTTTTPTTTSLQLQLRYTPLHHTTLHYTALHCITLQYTTLHFTPLHYIALHYIRLRYSRLHYTTLHYITLHLTTLHFTPHSIPLHYATKKKHYTTLHSTTLHYTTGCYTTQHSTTLHYATPTTLHYITLHYTHYTTLHYTTWHYITLHFTPIHYITLQ